MFDVKAINEITITEIEVNVRQSLAIASIEVYVKDGASRGFTSDPSAWDKIGTCNVTPNDVNKPTILPYGCFEPINIRAGDTKALYLTIVPGSADGMNYMIGNSVGTEIIDDGNVIIYEGYGVDYPFSTSYFPRRWSGTLRYYTNQEISTRFDGSFVSNGIMFDIYSRSADILIEEMEVRLLSGDYIVEVWTKLGSHAGVDSSSVLEGWLRISSTSITSNGKDVLTPLGRDAFTAVGVDEQQRRAFYISILTDTNEVIVSTYNNISSDLNKLLKSDPFLSIFIGTSLGANFDVNNLVEGVSWNGALRYSLQAPDYFSQPPAITSTSAPTSSQYYYGESKLSTISDGSNFNDGCMFDFVAYRDLYIITFDVHVVGSATDDDVNIEIWYKEGSYYSDITDVAQIYPESDWKLVGDAYVQPKSEGNLSRLPRNMMEPIPVYEGYGAFYITVNPQLTLGYAKISYSNGNSASGTGIGDIFATNNEIGIFVGSGVAYSFSSVSSGPRIFNGAVYYAEADLSLSPTTAPSKLTLPLTFGWRLFAFSSETETGWKWDVSDVKFYEDNACAGNHIDQGIGLAFSSGYYNDEVDSWENSSFDPDEAFGGGTNYWGGR